MSSSSRPAAPSYLRSRRFYTGLAIGLIPLLFIAAQTLGVDQNGNASDRVVVRTYNTCPDSLSDRRTADLVSALPQGTVLVETYMGCCGCCCGGTATGQQGSSLHRAAPTSRGPMGHEYGAVAPGVAPEVDMLGSLPPMSGEAAGGYVDPSFLGVTEARERGGLAAWIPLLAAPLLIFRGGRDRPLPPGIICPDDSGLPTGPERPTC